MGYLAQEPELNPEHTVRQAVEEGVGNIDGVTLPDMVRYLLYGCYGNFNSARQSIDPELVRDIEIVKGADSFQAGSGSAGRGGKLSHFECARRLLPQRFGVMLKSALRQPQP